MGWIIGKGIGVPFRLGGSGLGSSYWSRQSEVLFFGLYSEISGGRMPNKVLGATDYLTVAGAAGSETYQCPNTAAYIAADTDYIWFKTDTTQRTTTTAELIGYDLQRTPVKYNDSAPNAIVSIMILKAGETIAGTKRDKMFTDFWLPVMWDNSLSAYGHVKDNRGATQQLFTVEDTTEVATYITGLATPLSAGQKTLLNTLVGSIKIGMGIANLSDHFDCMYILAGETEESSLKNLVKNAHHCTNVHATAFVALEGFTGDGTNDYLDTNYSPNSQSIRFAQDDGSAGIYIRTNVNETKADMGLVSPGTVQTIALMNLSGTFYGRINLDAATSDISEVTTPIGLFMATRDGSAAGDIDNYKNKTTIGTKTGVGVSQSLLNANVYIGALHRTIPYDAAILPSTRQYSFAFIGKHTTTTQRDVIVDAIEAYMDANGKGII